MVCLKDKILKDERRHDMAMSESERLARWLLHSKAVPESILTPLWHEARKNGADIGEALLLGGHLNPDKLASMRDQAEKAWIARQDVEKTPPNSEGQEIQQVKDNEQLNRKLGGPITLPPRRPNQALIADGEHSDQQPTHLQSPGQSQDNGLVRPGGPNYQRPDQLKNHNDRPTMKFENPVRTMPPIIAAESQGLSSDPVKVKLSGSTPAESVSLSWDSSQSESGEVIKKQLDDYLVHEEISRGGMGVVFRAHYKPSNDEVALKVMLGRDPPLERIERFSREANSLKLISHENIVKLYDHGMTTGRPYYAMELIRGTPLKDYIKDYQKTKGTVPDVKWTCRVIAKIGQALLQCHQSGIYHRDVKPENILIEPQEDGSEDRPVLVDFGLVKHERATFDSSDSKGSLRLTKTGAVLGTPKYMAPEQLETGGHFGDIGSHTDVWGLAATLYYCLTGEAPYKGASLVNIYKALMTDDPKPVSAVNPGLPGWIVGVCQSALIRESTDRIALQDFIDRLERPDQYFGVKRSLARAFLAVCGLMVVAAVGLLLWLNQDRTAPSFHIDGMPQVVSSRTIFIAGQVIDEAPDFVIARIGSQKSKARVSQDGRFRMSLTLKRSKNLIKMSAVDKAGNKSRSMERVVRFDGSPPLLKVSRAQERSFDESVTLTGTINEPGCTIRCGEVSLRPKSMKFQIFLPLKLGKNTLTLHAIDLAGNKSKLVSVNIKRDTVVTVGASAQFKTVAGALRAVKNNTRIQLQPGTHFVSNEAIVKSVEIRGDARKPRSYIVMGKSGSCFTVNVSGVRFSGLSFAAKKVEADLPNVQLVKVSGGIAFIDHCRATAIQGGAFGVTSINKSNKSELTVEDSEISGCEKGALAVQGPAAKLWMKNTKIFDNRDTGLWITANGWSKVTHCKFLRNRIGSHSWAGATVEFIDCLFQENTKHGLYINDGGLANTVTLRRCKVVKNGFGQSRPEMPGILCYKGNVLIYESEVIGSAGHGVVIDDLSNFYIESSRFANNRIAGIYLKNSKLDYHNLDFDSNGRAVLLKGSRAKAREVPKRIN
jgi:serine/threonine protein kinase